MGSPNAGGPPGGGGTKKGSGRDYVKPKAKGLIPGFIKALKTGRESDLKKRKEAKINDSYVGNSDYQGDVKAPPTITDVLNEQKAQKERDGENTIKKVTETAPTEAEVSQSAATDTTAVAETKKVDDIYTRKKKSKARGRSMMTLTSAQGIKKDDNLVLGKRSLLGS